MKTFSTYQIKTGKKDIERRVLYAYRQERYNVEFLMMKKRLGWFYWFTVGGYRFTVSGLWFTDH